MFLVPYKEWGLYLTEVTEKWIFGYLDGTSVIFGVTIAKNMEYSFIFFNYL